MTEPLYDRLVREVTAAGLPATGDDDPITEADLEPLPAVVQRYLRFMAVVGRPRVWSFQARFSGRFRLRPRLGWMPAEAWQYNSAVNVARIFVMRLRFARIVPLIGVDSYVDGQGHMRGKLIDRITVVDGRGSEFDVGELTTYLNDAVLLEPSMLLRAPASWTGIDDDTFEVGLTNAGCRVSARVLVDERGAPVDFISTDRFADLGGSLVRAEWHTPVDGWEDIDGRPFISSGRATWHLPDGPLTYIEGRFAPASVITNFVPGRRETQWA